MFNLFHVHYFNNVRCISSNIYFILSSQRQLTSYRVDDYNLLYFFRLLVEKSIDNRNKKC